MVTTQLEQLLIKDEKQVSLLVSCLVCWLVYVDEDRRMVTTQLEQLLIKDEKQVSWLVGWLVGWLDGWFMLMRIAEW